MYVLTQAPEKEPLSVREVQDHLRVSGQDEELFRLIKTARGMMERYLNRALITQEWDVYFDCWHYEMKLPYPPLQTVDSVKYRDLDGAEQTLSSSFYHVTNNEPATIVRAYDVSWPELQYGRPQAVKISITVGYGDDAADIPEEIRHGMKLIITDLYENRGTVVLGSVNKIPAYLIDLVHSYRIYEF